MKIKEAITKGYISKIGAYWYAEGLNLSCNTPFEALRDWKKKQDEDKKKREIELDTFYKSPIGVYWKSLTEQQKRKIRLEYSESNEYDILDLYTYAYNKKGSNTCNLIH